MNSVSTLLFYLTPPIPANLALWSGVLGTIRVDGRQSSSFQLPSGMFKTLLLVSLTGFIAWAYKAIQPPPSKICGSPDGPSVTAPRIKLRDGRHLAYKENGVPKDTAKYKFIYVHAFGSCRHEPVIASNLSPEIIEKLRIYVVSIDRPGYGESDPDPKRTPKSIALDIEELADQLAFGSKFYVLGTSMGGQTVWGCLKYIPHRLAGATLIAPVINFWLPGFPANLSKVAYKQRLRQDQWSLRVAHYTPWLFYWWNKQKLLPSSSIISKSPENFSHQDKEIMKKYPRMMEPMGYVKQQGEYESIYRDIMVGFGDWGFDPMDMENPFPNNEGSVHLWQGDEDKLVPVMLQRYIVQKLPWIRYHELSGAGHLFMSADGMANEMVIAQLT